MSWRSIKLGDTCDVIAGGTPKRSEPSYWGGEIPWVKISDMLQGRISQTDETITRAGLEGSSAKLLGPGTLLVSIFATIGRTAVLECEAATNQAIVGVIPRQQGQFDDRFLQHSLRKKTQELQRQGRGVAQANINGSVLKATELPVPPLAEQERIAGILDAADTLRVKRREALAQLDALLQSTFLDMFGDPVTNPMAWDAPHLADFCRTGSGGTPSRKRMQRYYEGGTIPWVKSGELREEVISSTNEYITQAALKETSVKLVPKDALLVALYGATVGRLGILGTQATTNQAVCHIIPNPLRADCRYMFHCLSSQVPYLVGRGVGGAQPNISQGLVKSLTIPLPPLDLQHRFAAIVESVEQQKARQQAHLAELNTLFASLQSRAFRGDL